MPVCCCDASSRWIGGGPFRHNRLRAAIRGRVASSAFTRRALPRERIGSVGVCSGRSPHFLQILSPSGSAGRRPRFACNPLAKGASGLYGGLLLLNPGSTGNPETCDGMT
ncbi:hypothetical protein R1flu_016461 [Riccia fluitans]|uniref:Uncharacterized protein n=1 Tax=Riccia fluitans TaxID=41844 RepID=A0ABD1YM44_9MARC